ncbi:MULTISPECIES: hypothetical protein [Cyanophyceae]|uniref:slr1601 family putative cell division protein n=2 Tax=Cyanobacteriota TaxID=1117 RepID=UPI001685E177|nr:MULTISPECIES: hypothetical protein [Cyanophyceae]MBD1917050.1 hypothetical protein [Phormidium sp. FACHB-77]MBD2030581.1 hypothetical protein [Phormidium sp. FACHB-322]MBD2050311.1 hypothetical protein [Leptolyngbya sp. FACHB-60]
MRRSRSRSPLPTSSVNRMPAQRRRGQRRADPLRRLARHTPVFELSARLGVNCFLMLVAAVSLARLVPYLQAQVQQLEVVHRELDQAEVTHARLRADFDRYFDPAQAGRVIQEQTGYRTKSERHVVWTD